jgi:Uma2 family endonuclease
MAAVVSVSTSRRMSAQEYLAWESTQEEKHDWYDGEVFAMSGGTMRHAALTMAMGVELATALRGGPCRVFSSDPKIAARRDLHYVYPDISVVCATRELEPGTTDVVANPTVIVEVLSARTEAYDRGAKWTGYQQLASLTDFFLVSQATTRIEQYQRTGPDSWSYRSWGAGEKVSLANGATIDVDTVYAGVFELDGE